MKQSKQPSAVNTPGDKTLLIEKLRAEASQFSRRLNKINTELFNLERDQRLQELERNVGKYFVENISGTCDRFLYVIGVDSKTECNNVISVAIAKDGWCQFQRISIPWRHDKFRPISRRRFMKQLQKVKLLFEQAEQGQVK